jgi:AcrR family transcriptional regulator
MLAERGADIPSLREVARRVGVSNAAPYRHFASLDDLLEEVRAEIFHDLADQLGQGAGRFSGDAGEQLVALGCRYVQFVVGHRTEARLLFSRPKVEAPGQSPALEAAHQAFAVLTAAVTAAQEAGTLRDGSAEDIALTMWALVHGIAALTADGQLGLVTPADIEQLVRSRLEMLLSGLRQQR